MAGRKAFGLEVASVTRPDHIASTGPGPPLPWPDRRRLLRPSARSGSSSPSSSWSSPSRSLFAQGLNLGLDFEGGQAWDVPASETFGVDEAERGAARQRRLDRGVEDPGPRAAENLSFVAVQIEVVADRPGRSSSPRLRRCSRVDDRGGQLRLHELVVGRRHHRQGRRGRWSSSWSSWRSSSRSVSSGGWRSPRSPPWPTTCCSPSASTPCSSSRSRRRR